MSINHFLNSSDFSTFKSNLNSMRMGWRISQYVFDDTCCSLASSLILFLNNINLKAGPYIFSILPIHFFCRSLLLSQARPSSIEARPAAMGLDHRLGQTMIKALFSHFVTKRHHAALIGFDLCQMQGDVSVELVEEWDPLTNQDRQDRITNFVG